MVDAIGREAESAFYLEPFDQIMLPMNINEKNIQPTLRKWSAYLYNTWYRMDSIFSTSSSNKKLTTLVPRHRRIKQVATLPLSPRKAGSAKVTVPSRQCGSPWALFPSWIPNSTDKGVTYQCGVRFGILQDARRSCIHAPPTSVWNRQSHMSGDTRYYYWRFTAVILQPCIIDVTANVATKRYALMAAAECF